MARKRMIDPDIWTDEKVLELPSTLAVLLYIGTISMADDAGRLEWSPSQIKFRLFPHREDVSLRSVETAMAALVTLPDELKDTDDGCPLLVAYKVRGRNYAYHPNWRKHQYVNRPTPSKLPAPPDDSGGAVPSNGRVDSVQSPEKAHNYSGAKTGVAPEIIHTTSVPSSVTFQTHGASPDILQIISVPLESESESESESGVESDARMPAREKTLPTHHHGREATERSDEMLLDEDELDLPASPITAAPSPVIEFAKWFVLSGIEAGVIPKHHKLDPLDYARGHDGLKAAKNLVETYGQEECEVRTRRLFRAITAEVCHTASIEALSMLWDKPDIAGVPAITRLRAVGEYEQRAPLPLRGFERDKRRAEDVPLIGVPRTSCPACGSSDHTEPRECKRYQNHA